MRTTRPFLRFTTLATLLFVTFAASATHFVHFDLKQRGAATLVLQDTARGRYAILIDTGMASAQPGRGGAKITEYLHE